MPEEKKRRQRRSFTDEFKAEVVRKVLAGSKTAGQVARDLDLTETAVRKWVKQSQVDRGKGPPGALTTAEKEELARLRKEVREAPRGPGDPKKSRGLLREAAQVKFAFIDAEKAFHRITKLCRVLEVSRAGFYAWCGRGPSARAVEDARLAILIREAHERSRRTYGSPRVHADLQARGIFVSRNRVIRLMQAENLAARQRRRYRVTNTAENEQPVAPNLLDRQFRPSAPNQSWVADTTYLRAGDGWLYLAVVVDLYSRFVVGWATSAVHDQQLVTRALEMAVRRRRPDAGLLHHSDQGTQYTSEAFRRVLGDHGITCSMSRRGNVYDNAAMESWFSTLKSELGERFESHGAAKEQLFDYIEVFYNQQRRHSVLGYLSPAEFERAAQAARSAA